MARKKKERESRLDNPPAPPAADKSNPGLSDLQLLLPGMIAFFTGAKSYVEVEKITEKCRRFGEELLLDVSSCGKKSKISSRWLEAEQ